MAAARVGSITTGGSSSWAAAAATTNPQAPTAGNTRILSISAARGTSAPATITIGGTGWVLMGSATGVSGTFWSGVFVYAQIAAGGDAAPTIQASVSSNLTWTLEEWSGLASSLITTGIPLTGDVETSSGAVSLDMTRVAASDGEFQFAALGGRSATVNPTVTWGGGLTANWNTSSGRVAQLKSATGSIATSGGSMTGTVSLTNNQGGPLNALVMVPFALAGGPPPAADSGIVVGGAVAPYVTKNVIKNGVKDAVETASIIDDNTKKPVV